MKIESKLQSFKFIEQHSGLNHYHWQRYEHFDEAKIREFFEQHSDLDQFSVRSTVNSGSRLASSFYLNHEQAIERARGNENFMVI